jgi:hypothetical protein
MAKDEKSLAAFDTWVKDFAAHVAGKGPVPDTKDAERAARSTTNRDEPRG